jgi:hypothetical protein
MNQGTVMRGALYVLVTLCAACSGEPCEDAGDKLDECVRGHVGGQSTATYLRRPLHFDGACESASEECVAECVNDASCPAIRWAVIGGVVDPNASAPEDADDFERCLRACGLP